jgi:hypothetical protein
MKQWILFILGFIPFPVGYLINHMILNSFPVYELFYTIVSLVFLGIWFLVGMFLYHLAGTKIKAAVIANCPAFIVLLLVLFQEVILGRYWMNFIGLAGQLYYLPLLSLTFKLTPMFHTMPPAYIAAFCLMYFAFYSGCCVGIRHEKSA